MSATIDGMTDGVESVNGVPIVISKWGFKKTVVNGAVYLEALTRGEVKEAYLRDGTRSVHEVEKISDAKEYGDGCYVGNYGGCMQISPCKAGCHKDSLAGAGWMCNCLDHHHLPHKVGI